MRRALLALLMIPLAAVSRGAGIIIEPAQKTVIIGSPFEIMGEATIPAEAFLKPPPKDGANGEFEIMEVEFGDPKTEGDHKILPIRIRASAFALGEQTLPEMTWTLVSPNGSETALKSPPQSVTVAPPKPKEGDSGDIRPIKGPYEPEMRRWYAMAGLVLLLLIATAIYAWRKRNGGKPVLKADLEPKDDRSFEQIALDEINALPGLRLSAKEFYDRLSDIVRLYLQRRCDLSALTSTSYDLNREMVKREIDPSVRALMKSLLQHADLAKFAKHEPAESQYGADCGLAKEIVSRLVAGQSAPTAGPNPNEKTEVKHG